VLAERMVRELNIRTPSVQQKAEQLSGGNQQKVSLAKWLSRNCSILIIDEPTVGVDVGAKEQIHQIIWNLARMQRKAVIVISSDMSEIIRLASRILVFKDHRIVGEVRDVDAPGRSVEEVSSVIGKLLVQ
jgi:ribose transport system ATP-binding protein